MLSHISHGTNVHMKWQLLILDVWRDSRMLWEAFSGLKLVPNSRLVTEREGRRRWQWGGEWPWDVHWVHVYTTDWGLPNFWRQLTMTSWLIRWPADHLASWPADQLKSRRQWGGEWPWDRGFGVHWRGSAGDATATVRNINHTKDLPHTTFSAQQIKIWIFGWQLFWNIVFQQLENLRVFLKGDILLSPDGGLEKKLSFQGVVASTADPLLPNIVAHHFHNSGNSQWDCTGQPGDTCFW